MAFILKHHEVTVEQVRRIEADPDSVTTPADEAVLHYLTLPDEKRQYELGRFTLGRFEVREVGDRNCLHTGSVIGGDFQRVAEGVVIDDSENPDGLYEIYVPI